MRIAQIAPLQVAVPPHQYGGTERCVSQLTEALVALGHDVTLFASQDSHTSAHLIAPVEHAINFDPDIAVQGYEIGMLAQIYRQASVFDVIQAHLGPSVLPYAAQAVTPTVITLHDRLDQPDRRYAFRQYRQLNYVAISQSQQAFLPELHWVGVVHHGVDVASFPFSPDPGTYLAFVGRISPQKGPDRAIAVAQMTGIPLKIAAKVDTAERPYFEHTIQPLLADPIIDFLGEVDESRKRDLMSHALALILPIDWPEPFGIVFTEALACGTPVLTCPLGAAPEVVQDGETGYLCSTIEDLAEAATQIPTSISRMHCRQYAEERFDTRYMAHQYVQIYDQLVNENTWQS
jgi:glycosyltransferase involved in cell wall biosynthesis